MSEERTCENCEITLSPEDDYVELEEGLFCMDCFEDCFRTCENCDRVVLANELEQNLCERCRDNYFFVCNVCGNWTHMENCVADDSTSMCESCFNRYYGFCENCDRIYPSDELEGGLCDECRQNGIIYDYEYKPYPIFHPPGPYVFYGMELEVDKFKNALESAREWKSDEIDFYMKRDGSLENKGSRGIEFVFHPRTIESWMEYKPKLEVLSREILREGGRSFDTITCGIHIHRSREDLSDMDISKLIIAMLRFEKKIGKIAQRVSEDYASFDFWKEETEGNLVLHYKKVKDKKYDSKRYVALNLCNQETIEFRMFKGTLKIDTVYAYIQFCDVLTEWAKKVGVSKLVLDDSSVLWEGFAKEVKVSKHKELKEYMKRKELL